jgi:hypothetical protein
MPSRLFALRRSCRVGAVFLALPLAAPAAAVVCAGSAPAAFELGIGSGAMRDGEESRIAIQAHADGCVGLHRPWFLRDAGDYELRLDAREWAALQGAIAAAQLDKIDARRLGAQTDTVWQDAAPGNRVYADPDADLVVLRWREGDVSHQLQARAPEAAAQRQPQAAEVGRMAAAVGALRALLQRPGTRVEGTP